MQCTTVVVLFPVVVRVLVLVLVLLVLVLVLGLVPALILKKQCGAITYNVVACDACRGYRWASHMRWIRVAFLNIAKMEVWASRLR